jgi:hypothetical protein
MNDASKIPLVEPKTYEAPKVKEEPYDEEDTDHCLMYDMAGSQEGWYSDASCIELPFS